MIDQTQAATDVGRTTSREYIKKTIEQYQLHWAEVPDGKWC